VSLSPLHDPDHRGLASELGTLYPPDEIRVVADIAHGHGMSLHLDGARIWNAAASLDAPLRAFTADAGSTS